MSELSEQATTSILLSDFANVTEVGKLNVVGAGVTMLGFEAQQGVTARFSLVAIIEAPPSVSLPVDCTIEFTLYSEGSIVEVPGPAGPQTMRIGQTSTIEIPALPVNAALRGKLSGRNITVLDFSSGLPLIPGTIYEWVVQIDGDSTERHTYPFIVAGPQQQPVIG